MIKEIQIKNFKGIDELTIYPQKVNILHGENGAGKSSVLEALQYLFSGKGAVLKKGEKEGHILAVFDDGTTVERIFKEKETSARVNGKKTTLGSVLQYLETAQKIDLSVQNALLSGGSLDENPYLSALYLSVLKVQIKKESLEKMVKNIRDCDIFYVLEEKDFYNLDDLNKAYKEAVARRKEVNAKIRSLKPLIKEDLKKPDLTEKEIKEKLLKISQQIASEKESYASWEKEERKRNNAIARQEALKEQLKSLNNVKYPDVILRELAEAEDKEGILEKETKELQKEIVSLEAQNKQSVKMLSALKEMVCPISEKLICVTDKRPLKEELQNSIDKNLHKISGLQDELKKKEKILSDVKAQIKNLNKESVLAEKKNGIEGQIKLLEIPEKKERPAVHDDLQKEYDALTLLLKEAAVYEEAFKAKKELEEKNKEFKILNNIVYVLDPKTGVQRFIIERTASSLEKECGNIKIKLDMDSKQNISVFAYNKKDGEEILLPISSLSSGEKKQANAAIAKGLSKKAKILSIDDADRLDHKRLQEYLKNMQEQDAFEHVFLAITDHGENMALDKSFNIIRM